MRPTAPTARVPVGALVFAWCGAAVFAGSLLYFLYCYLIRFGRTAATGPLATPIVIDVLLFTGFALHHSVFARPAIKRHVTARLRLPLERSLYTWIASALFLVVCAAWRDVPGQLYQLTGAAAVAGYVLQAIGAWLTARSSARLDVLDLAGVRPVIAGGLKPAGPHAGSATPEPRAPPARRSAEREGGSPESGDHVPLVTTGLYGFVRHPLYFAWTLLVFAAPHMTLTRFTFAAVSTAYLAIAIPFEEQSLIRVFGGRYREYQRNVRWRMIPGLY
jgi:protein-S-isoprenylcysteine O-methyltransferase Ste14